MTVLVTEQKPEIALVCGFDYMPRVVQYMSQVIQAVSKLQRLPKTHGSSTAYSRWQKDMLTFMVKGIILRRTTHYGHSQSSTIR